MEVVKAYLCGHKLRFWVTSESCWLSITEPKQIITQQDLNKEPIICEAAVVTITLLCHLWVPVAPQLSYFNKPNGKILIESCHVHLKKYGFNYWKTELWTHKGRMKPNTETGKETRKVVLLFYWKYESLKGILQHMGMGITSFTVWLLCLFQQSSVLQLLRKL